MRWTRTGKLEDAQRTRHQHVVKNHGERGSGVARTSGWTTRVKVSLRYLQKYHHSP